MTLFYSIEFVQIKMNKNQKKEVWFIFCFRILIVKSKKLIFFFFIQTIIGNRREFDWRCHKPINISINLIKMISLSHSFFPSHSLSNHHILSKKKKNFLFQNYRYCWIKLQFLLELIRTEISNQTSIIKIAIFNIYDQFCMIFTCVLIKNNVSIKSLNRCNW